MKVVKLHKKNSVRLPFIVFKGAQNKEWKKKRTLASFGIGIRNIHAKNHDNSSRRMAVILKKTDEMTNIHLKAETSLRSVNIEEVSKEITILL